MEQVLTARKVVDTIYVDDKVKEYIVNLVCATRNPGIFNVPAEGLILWWPPASRTRAAPRWSSAPRHRPTVGALGGVSP